MMPNLTQAQIDVLTQIANSGQSGARVAYYAKLKEFGIPYGSLAQGVVLEDQISGRVANAYFMAVAEREGVTVSSQQWAAIGDGLMQADLEARLGREDVAADGTVTYTDLDYTDIRDYHASVFSNLGGTVPTGQGVSIQGWTAYAPVETFGVLTWSEMLEESSIYQHVYGAVLLGWMWVYSNFESGNLADEWGEIMGSVAFQTFLSDGSPAQFSDQLGNSHLVLGTHTDEQLAIDGSIPAETQVLVMGLGGADTISVGGDGDYFDGGAGDDLFLVSDIYGDVIHGGSGTDSADFSSHSIGIGFGLGSGYDSAGLGDLRSIERIIATEQADTFYFHGTISSTTVESINAGGGVDMLFLPHAGEQLQVDLEIGRLLGLREIELVGVEDVVGGDGADIILGSSVANSLSGGLGNDEIEGRDGNDLILGGAGRDHLFGDAGDDSINGDEGNDVLNGGDGHDRVVGGIANDSLVGGAGIDTLYGGEGSDTIRGGWHRDILQGDSGRDWLFGDAGNDQLTGGADDDWLDGGAGTDTLFGGLGADTYVCGPGEDFIPNFELGIDRLAGSGVRTFEQVENSFDLRVTAGGYSVILAFVSLEQALSYDGDGLLWA